MFHLAFITGQARKPFLAQTLTGAIVAFLGQGAKVIAQTGLAVGRDGITKIARFALFAFKS